MLSLGLISTFVCFLPEALLRDDLSRALPIPITLEAIILLIYDVILPVQLHHQIDASKTSLYIQAKYPPIEDHIHGRHSASSASLVVGGLLASSRQ